MALKTVIKRPAAAQSVLFVCDVQELLAFDIGPLR